MKKGIIGSMIGLLAGATVTHLAFAYPWVPAFIGSGIGVVVFWLLTAIDYVIFKRNARNGT